MGSKTIPAFCQAHHISRGTYYNLKRAGTAPREMRIGEAVRISEDAELDWIREREGQPAAERDGQEAA